MSKTPKETGYRMPAEWEKHDATWLSWPHNVESWPGKFDGIPETWAIFTKLISVTETVHICAGGDQVMKQAESLVGNIPGVILHNISTNDAWIRDHGPTFLVGEDLPPALVNWKYNAWGEKYPPFDLDNEVPTHIAKILNRRTYEPGIVLEGGSIDVNGAGILLTTEQCLLNQNRNPHLNKEEIEDILRDYLNVSKILWLGEGIIGDDTDGHIDDIARFVDENTIVTVVEEDSTDENYPILQNNLARLKEMTDLKGRSFNIIELPMPGPVIYDGERLPASYANFYIANEQVIVPTYSHPNDERAIGILQEFFFDREVKGFPAVDLVWGLGACHCISQQQPNISDYSELSSEDSIELT